LGGRGERVVGSAPFDHRKIFCFGRFRSAESSLGPVRGEGREQKSGKAVGEEKEIPFGGSAPEKIKTRKKCSLRIKTDTIEYRYDASEGKPAKKEKRRKRDQQHNLEKEVVPGEKDGSNFTWQRRNRAG